MNVQKENHIEKSFIKDYLLELQTIQHGIPQGSILGPFLSHCYINDIPSATNSSGFVYRR
jgi:hypothetical protein